MAEIEYKSFCKICGIKIMRANFCDSHRKYSLGRKCQKCGVLILDNNKTGFCTRHSRGGELNPFFGKTHTKETKQRIKEIAKINTTNLWKDQKYRSKIIKGISKPRPESFGKRQSERVKKWFMDNPEQRQIRSLKMAESWKTGKIPLSPRNCCNRSKKEKGFFNDIKELFGDDAKRVTLTLRNGKWRFPDILLVDIGMILEFYGDYWHANPCFYNPQDIVHHKLTAMDIWKHDKQRAQMLSDEGYSIHIVWENDYKRDKNSILNQINNWLNWDSCCL